MKAKNSLLLFIISAFLWSCFDSPDFSPVPRIRFEQVCFGKSRDELKPDSLVIEISFEDGDGDLGIPQNLNEEPFHELNYFIGDASGNLIPVGKRTIVNGYPRFLNIPNTVEGKLLAKRSRKNPLFTNKMVPYTADSACLYYTKVDSVYIKRNHIGVLEDFMTYKETPFNPPADDPQFTSILMVKDTFYVQRNPGSQNIDVLFYRKRQDPSDPSKAIFEYVNWDKMLCTQIFDARFPRLSDRPNALSGTIRYSMRSTQLESMMGSSIWKLKVRIRDRQLNTSNLVESREFTLDEIRQCQQR